MKELAILVWIIILIILFIGTNVIYLIIANVVVLVLVWIFKPEWFDRL